MGPRRSPFELSGTRTGFVGMATAALVSLQSMFGTPPALGVAINLNAGAALTFANAWTTPSATLFEVNGATSKIFNNNFTTASASGNAGSNTLTSLSVGSQNVAGGPGNTWSGTMAEIICFSKILTATQKGVLRTYLNNRYALSRAEGICIVTFYRTGAINKRRGKRHAHADEAFWLDLEAFQDVVFFVEVREVSAAPTLALQTAPADDSLFSSLNDGAHAHSSATLRLLLRCCRQRRRRLLAI